MEEKFFAWYDSGSEGPMYGPYFHFENKKLYHSLTDLLQMESISVNVKKRLSNAKIGTKIKVQYLHSAGDLMLKRIDENEIKILNQIDAYYGNLEPLKLEVRELEQKIKKLSEKFTRNNENN